MMMKELQRRTFLKTLGGFGLAVPAMAQFGGQRILGKSGPALPMPPTQFIEYIALATNFAVEGTQKLLSVYPPEKIEQIKQLCAQYNEAMKQNKSGEIDEASLKLASQAGEEASKLDAAAATLDAEKKKALHAANRKLALCLVADGFAALNVNNYVDSLKRDVQSASMNPMKAMSAGKLKSQLQTLTFAAVAIPSQVTSFGTVRGTAKKIAEAQQMTLPDDPKPETLRSVDQVKRAGQAVLTAAGPAQLTICPNRPVRRTIGEGGSARTASSVPPHQTSSARQLSKSKCYRACNQVTISVT